MIMSRKNKNGSRRNYSPRTYSRDFLKPTPIERAIQDVNKPASPQAVAVSDRIACDDKCSYEYKRMPAAWLETDFSYQRKIDSARVERIVNSFDPRLANEVKVSFRDGKFYVFDGAHTLSALKRIHGEETFMVDCKVYYGLSYEDEAYLFALQSGESRDVAFNTRLRALMLSGSQEATDFRAHTAQAGFQLADGAGSATKNTIAAIAKAYRLYKEYGPEQYVQILQLLSDTWNGAAWSVTGYLLGGVAVFLREYGADNCELVQDVRSLAPDLILLGGDFVTYGEGTNYDNMLSLFRQLSEIAPVCGVLGNHEDELYFLDNDRELVEKFTAAGVTVLRNQEARYTIHDNVISILGVEGSPADFSNYGASTFMDSVEPQTDYDLRICLAHVPTYFPEHLENYAFELGLPHLHQPCAHGLCGLHAGCAL